MKTRTRPKLTATAMRAIVVASIGRDWFSSARTTSFTSLVFVFTLHNLPLVSSDSSFARIRSCSGVPKCIVALLSRCLEDEVDIVVVSLVVTLSRSLSFLSFSCRFCSSKVRSSSTMFNCVDVLVLAVVVVVVDAVGRGRFGRRDRVTIAGTRILVFVVVVVEVVVMVVDVSFI